MIQIVKEYLAIFRLKWVLFRECILFWRDLCCSNASINTDGDIRKMQYTILRENHVIEKGMSMEKPKKGFGQQKVLALINRLRKYNELYGNKEKNFLDYPIATIVSYIAFTKRSGVEIVEIERRFKELLTLTSCDSQGADETKGGVKVVQKDIIQSEAQSSFDKLLYSRHSIRYFSQEVPSKDVIEMALQLAQQTPSACNRQGWKTHVYFADRCNELLHLQGGCNGFEDAIKCAIVVTADMRAFLSYEPMQCYVDGGLYMMNLINACHYLGLGTIPLSLGFYADKLRKIKKEFEIPDEEVLIGIVGVGEMLEEFNVAHSTRKAVALTNKYH